MSNKQITQEPTVIASSLSDIIYAVQGYNPPTTNGTSVQETIQQVLSLITAGSNISVSFVGGNLQIAAIGIPGTSYTHVTSTSATMAADSIFGADNAGLVSLLLPATAAAGTQIQVWGIGAGGWKIMQSAGQSIKIGPSTTTTTGTGGSLASTGQYDTVTLGCITANTVWSANAITGAGLTVV